MHCDPAGGHTKPAPAPPVQIRSHGTADTPAHNSAGIHVDHKGHVLPALPGRDVGEVRYPQLVWPIGFELAIDPVQRAWQCFVGDRGAHDLATARPLQPQAFHQSLNGAACHFDAFAPHLMPDPVGAVGLHVGPPDLLDLRHQDVIRLGPCAAQLGLALARSMTPIPGWGNLQGLADRLDTVGGAMFVHKVLQDLSRRSSSAWAKKRSPVSGFRWPGAAPCSHAQEL